MPSSAHTAGCPRCPAPVGYDDGLGQWTCASHGPVPVLWRPEEPSYEGFVEHLRLAGPPDGAFPTYLPWPLGPGWSVTDFAVVVADGGRPQATLTCCTGASMRDGPVDVIVVAEEPGTGLGARCAGTRHADPGAELGLGAATARLRVENHQVPLWPVSTVGTTGEWDRSVLVGELRGRWLWLVLRPASAALLLHDDLLLRDIAGLGPALLGAAFGGPRPPW